MVAGVSKATKQLDSMFANVVNQTIAAEKQMRLAKLQTQRDALDLKSAIYIDLQSYFQNLQTSARTLISSEDSYTLSTTKKATISDTPTGLKVASATATDEAVAGDYEIEVISLAKAHRVASSRLTSSSEMAGVSGTMTINDVDINVAMDDSLLTIAGKINSAVYAEGKSVSATVIDNRLVITSNESGAENAMSLSGAALQSLGVIDESNQVVFELNPASNAEFIVNGISVSNAKNTGIDDVIAGVTLNLASDAEGNKALLTISTDTNSVKNSVTAVLKKFNESITYLQAKTQTVKVEEKNYQRGGLADDYAFRNLISEMTDLMVKSSSGASTIKSIFDLGIEMDDKLNFTVTDTDKFAEVLENHREDLMSFLESKMTGIDSLINSYLETNGIMSYSLKNLDLQKQNLASSISAEEERLSRREDLLIEQYAQMQAMMDELLNTQQTMNALLYGTYTSTTR